MYHQQWAPPTLPTRLCPVVRRLCPVFTLVQSSPQPGFFFVFCCSNSAIWGCATPKWIPRRRTLFSNFASGPDCATGRQVHSVTSKRELLLWDTGVYVACLRAFLWVTEYACLNTLDKPWFCPIFFPLDPFLKLLLFREF